MDIEMPDTTLTDDGRVTCDTCGASASTSSKEYGRFMKRHPVKCRERREFSRQLAEGVRSVEADPELEPQPEVEQPDWVGQDKHKPIGYDPNRKIGTGGKARMARLGGNQR